MQVSDVSRDLDETQDLTAAVSGLKDSKRHLCLNLGDKDAGFDPTEMLLTCRGCPELVRSWVSIA